MSMARTRPAIKATISVRPIPLSIHQIAKIIRTTPIIVWNLPSHLASFSRYLPKAGMLVRIPMAKIKPPNININPISNAIF